MFCLIFVTKETHLLAVNYQPNSLTSQKMNVLVSLLLADLRGEVTTFLKPLQHVNNLLGIEDAIICLHASESLFENHILSFLQSIKTT